MLGSLFSGGAGGEVEGKGGGMLRSRVSEEGCLLCLGVLMTSTGVSRLEVRWLAGSRGSGGS
jgi:hypothetical protein